jgi:hypothetical protein
MEKAHRIAFSRLVGLFTNRKPFRRLIRQLSDIGVIAGGSVVYALNKIVPKTTVKDIDVFILDCDTKAQCMAYLKIVNSYVRKLDLKVTYSNHGMPKTSVVDMKFENEDVTIQLIFSKMISAENVVNEFDLDYVQSYFHLSKFFSTESAINASKNKSIEKFFTRDIKFERLEKAAAKGYKTPVFGFKSFVPGNMLFVSFEEFVSGENTFTSMGHNYYEPRQKNILVSPELISILRAKNYTCQPRHGTATKCIQIRCEIKFANSENIYKYSCFSAQVIAKAVFKSEFSDWALVKLDGGSACNKFFIDNFNMIRIHKSQADAFPLNKQVNIIVRPYAYEHCELDEKTYKYKTTSDSRPILRCYIQLTNDNVLPMKISPKFTVWDAVDKAKPCTNHPLPSVVYNEPTKCKILEDNDDTTYDQVDTYVRRSNVVSKKIVKDISSAESDSDQDTEALISEEQPKKSTNKKIPIKEEAESSSEEATSEDKDFTRDVFKSKEPVLSSSDETSEEYVAKTKPKPKVPKNVKAKKVKKNKKIDTMDEDSDLPSSKDTFSETMRKALLHAEILMSSEESSSEKSSSSDSSQIYESPKNIERIRLLKDCVAGKSKTSCKKIKIAAYKKYLDLCWVKTGEDLYTEVCSYALRLMFVKNHSDVVLASELALNVKVSPVSSFDLMVKFINGF